MINGYELPYALQVDHALAPRHVDGAPDFTALYPKLSIGPDGMEAQLLWQMSALAAAGLSAGAAAVVGQLSKISSGWETAVADVLGPRVGLALRGLEDPAAEALTARFVAVADQLRVRLESGDVPWPRCTADELVLASSAAWSEIASSDLIEISTLAGALVDDPLRAIAEATGSRAAAPHRWFRRYADGGPLELGVRR